MNLIELFKDKISKKQIVAIVAIVTLAQLKADPMYIFGVAVVAILVQGLLETKFTKGEK